MVVSIVTHVFFSAANVHPTSRHSSRIRFPGNPLVHTSAHRRSTCTWFEESGRRENAIDDVRALQPRRRGVTRARQSALPDNEVNQRCPRPYWRRPSRHRPSASVTVHLQFAHTCAGKKKKTKLFIFLVGQVISIFLSIRNLDPQTADNFLSDMAVLGEC